MHVCVRATTTPLRDVITRAGVFAWMDGAENAASKVFVVFVFVSCC